VFTRQIDEQNAQDIEISGAALPTLPDDTGFWTPLANVYSWFKESKRSANAVHNLGSPPLAYARFC